MYLSFYLKYVYNNLCEVEVYGGFEMIKLNIKIELKKIILVIKNKYCFFYLFYNL